MVLNDCGKGGLEHGSKYYFLSCTVGCILKLECNSATTEDTITKKTADFFFNFVFRKNKILSPLIIS